uniref:Ionotropic glutamate receptor L-glutamate and glycine-binding domain-containing protein n=1 Tax=Anopheles dirus TaxID=7168 RepID=A0A182NQ34_9DIPT
MFVKPVVAVMNDTESPTVYELSTVPFPIPIKGVFFSKIIDFWQGEKFRTINNTFFYDKTNDLGSQRMRVVVLEHTPAVFKSAPSVEATWNTRLSEANLSAQISTQTHRVNFYYGLEIELLKAISKAMHFQMDFYETADAEIERWGTLRDNETLTGLLKEMHEGRADFAVADLHHTEYNLGFMDLTIPYNTECLTFLTPEALSDNSWKTLILPFNGEMWAGVLLSLLSVGFVFYAFSNTAKSIATSEHWSKEDSPESGYQMQLSDFSQTSSNPRKKPS